MMLEEQVKDSRSLAIQKVQNVMRNMQQTHIAELFPIMDSRETTEGSEEQIICRICHTGGEEVLIAPCKCIGSTQFVHATCLLTWFKKSVKNQCELCQHSVPIRKKTKPVSEVSFLKINKDFIETIFLSVVYNLITDKSNVPVLRNIFCKWS